MFKNLTKFIVNQMDPHKQFDPVESIADNEHFRPLCLLRKQRKSNRIFHPAPYYQQTGFTLDDVLLPGQDAQSIEEECITGITGGTEKRKGTRESKQGIVIPKGCTLAFKTIPLQIKDKEWDMRSFPKKKRRRIPMSRKIEIEPWLTEVEICCQIFTKLSPDLLLIILNTVKAVMRDKNLLQELRQKMEEVPEQDDGYQLETESPDLKDLCSTLQHSPRDHLLQLAEGITYVLDALHELTEDQLLLLLESLERKIVSQQLNLVANLLECDKVKRKGTFLVDARLLFPGEEEQRLTIALVELSGVQFQEDGSVIPRDKPFEAMAALFVALYALNILSGSQI
ncbi:hypothetical protein DV515_00018239 [Chloebia gouldiae]|uniref:Gasdermin PUB domain-containing protein n=2 Tax=Chloebia gouldiae TaxID=44316 RepID=A0A3L8Q817_CHLGU|nr:hypothetical protein DV515_00018239 [Chloebia gouldiae]